MEQTDEQWLAIADLFPDPPPNPNGGRPYVPVRPCLECVIWILITGAQWQDLPEHFAPKSTCHRRLHLWLANAVLLEAWRMLAFDLDLLNGLDLSEEAGDATFVSLRVG